MIDTAYPIDAVVTWDESFVPDDAQKFPWFLVLLTNLLNLWWNKKLYSYRVKQHVRTHWSDNLTVGDGN